MGLRSCPYYINANNLLKEKNYNIKTVFEANTMGEYKSKLENKKNIFKKKYMKQMSNTSDFNKIKTSPIIIIDNKCIGGYTDLKNLFTE